MPKFQIETRRGFKYEIETDDETELDGIVGQIESDEEAEFAKSRPLPEGVTPSTVSAGGGRGFVNPELPTETPRMGGRRGGTRAEAKPFVAGPAAPTAADIRKTEPVEPAKAAPYKSLAEALDDAVNLAEETGDLDRVTQAFAGTPITRAEIVLRGQERGSEMFKGIEAQPFPQTQRLTQPVEPKPVAAPTDRMSAIEPSKLEEYIVNPLARGAAGVKGAANVLGYEAGILGAESAAQGIVAAARMRDKYQPGSEIQRQADAVAEADKRGAADGMLALLQNPAYTLTAVTESIIASAPSLVAGVAAGLSTGPAGAAAAVGTASGATEYASSIIDTLSDQGKSATAQDIAGALQDPDFMSLARQKAAARGVAVGAFDAISAGVAGRFSGAVEEAAKAGKLSGRGLAKERLKAAGKELIPQAGFGAGGEAAAQLAESGQITSGSAIGLEAAGEMVGAPGEVIPNVYNMTRGGGLVAGQMPAATNFTPADSSTRSAGLTDIVVPIPEVPDVGVPDAAGGLAAGGGAGLGAQPVGGVVDPGSAPAVDGGVGNAAARAGTAGGADQPVRDVAPGGAAPALTDPVARTSDADLLSRIAQPAGPVAAQPGAGNGQGQEAEVLNPAADKAAQKDAAKALADAQQKAQRADDMLRAAQALGEPDTIEVARRVQLRAQADLTAAQQRTAALQPKETTTNVPTTAELGAQARETGATQAQGQGQAAPVGEQGAGRGAGAAAELSGSEWRAFATETGTKAVPRAEMPQIKAEHRGALTQFLGARGVTHEQVELTADELKPTQAEFSPAKVQGMVGADIGRSILVSSDGYVLDGHHQWLAAKESGQPVKAIRLNAPIDKLLPLAREFPSSTLEDGATTANEVTQDVSMSGGVMRINNLDVGNNQRAGLGREAVRKIIESAKARGVRRIELESREDAEGFWEKMGFRRTPGADDDLEAIGMHMDLAAPAASAALVGPQRAMLDSSLRAIERARAQRYGEQSSLKLAEDATPEEQAAIAFAEANGVKVAIVEETGKSNFTGAAVNGINVLVRGKDTDQVLSVAVHEGIHTLDDDIKTSLISAIEPTLRNREAFQKIYRYGSSAEARAKMTAEDRAAEDAMVTEEMVAMLGQSEAKRPEFWTKLATKMGDTAFGKFARHVLGKLDSMMGKYIASEKIVRDAWTTDLPLVQNALAEAYASQLKRRGLSKDADRAMAQYVSQDRAEQFSQRAYHGTPHRGIEKFSTEKIGTGEGAQAFGWGLYFAKRKDIAEFYRNQLSYSKLKLDGEVIEDSYDELQDKFGDVTGALLQFAVDDGYGNALAFAEHAVRPSTDLAKFTSQFDGPIKSATREQLSDALDVLRRVEKESSGQLYEVDIPDDTDLLDRDAKLKDQPQAVKDALAKLGIPVERAVIKDAATGKVLDDTSTDLAQAQRKAKGMGNVKVSSEPVDMTGAQAYTKLSRKLGGDKAASLALADEGVKGLKYLDANSRGAAGEKTHNFVIFRDEDVEVAGVQFSNALTATDDQLAPLGDRKITIDVDTGDGKTAKMTMGAADAVRDIQARIEAAKKLVGCLK